MTVAQQYLGNILGEAPQIRLVSPRSLQFIYIFHSKFIAIVKYMKEIAYLLFEIRGELETWFFSN